MDTPAVVTLEAEVNTPTLESYPNSNPNSSMPWLIGSNPHDAPIELSLPPQAMGLSDLSGSFYVWFDDNANRGIVELVAASRTAFSWNNVTTEYSQSQGHNTHVQYDYHDAVLSEPRPQHTCTL